MTVVEMLYLALEAHGIKCVIEDGLVRLVGDSDLSFEPRVFDGPPNAQSKIIQLDVVARSRRIAPHCIVESMGGMGSDQEAAERDAFGRFLLGPFHVLLTALAGHSCESNPAQWLEWQRNGTSWDICDGPLLVHGGEAGSTTYTEFLQQLENLFLTSVSRDVHWVRVFVASFNGKLAGADALLDNKPWPEAAALLNSWDWDFPQKYRSLRHFFVAVPRGSHHGL